MPVLHALSSVLIADIADLRARKNSALCLVCGCFSTWLPLASKPGLLAAHLSVFLLLLHFLHSVASLHCILHLLECLLEPLGLLCKLWALQQQHCILYTMQHIYVVYNAIYIYMWYTM